MNCSTPGLPVHHQLLEFTQIHVHRVSDQIQPSHPLSSPFPHALNPSQHHSLPMSQLFAWGGQSTGVSASASVLPMNIQDWFPLGLTCFPRDSQQFSPAPQFESFNSSVLSLLMVQLSNPYMEKLWKSYGTTWIFVGKVIFLLFNMLSRFVIAFLLRSKYLLISWLQSPSAMILESKKIKSLLPLFPLLFAMKWWDLYHEASVKPKWTD